MHKADRDNINYSDFEAYQEFCTLQSKLEKQVEVFFFKHQNCQCQNCTFNLIKTSLEFIKVNDIIAKFESILMPELNDLLTKATIQYQQSENGTIILKPNQE